MPIHAVVGHLALVSAPLTGLLALVYAAKPATRRALRWPVTVASIVNFGLVTWAEFAGTMLLDQLRAAAAASGGIIPDTVGRHAAHGEALAFTSFALMTVVIISGWRWLSPGAATPRNRRAVALLAAGALGLGFVSISTLMLGLESVWAQHPTYLTLLASATAPSAAQMLSGGG